MNIVQEVSHVLVESETARLRTNCQGMSPLDARLEPWMVKWGCERTATVQDAMNRYGSPLNVISTDSLIRNINQLNRVAADRELAFQVFFARKANKCLSLVDAAKQAGAGIDVASEQECQQTLDRGVTGAKVICTAAIKTTELIRLCVQANVTIAIDNADELRRVSEVASTINLPAEVAIRVSGFLHRGTKGHSRFGFDVDEVPHVAESVSGMSSLRVRGLHFHLDGYCADQRVTAIRQCVPLVDHFRSLDHAIRFLDIGGGLPMSYLESEQQWIEFWSAHREALLGQRSPITYKNHGLGFIEIEGNLHGRRNTYPYWQNPVRHDWLANILDSPCGEGGRIADALRGRDLQLRCEPGRSILDGCGITVARVEFVKRHHSGDWFVGLAMNRTQCRTGSDDFLVDPLVLPTGGMRTTEELGMTGYLVGAYCTESELISLRRLRFPHGIAAGDLVVLPNTAGYFMHFLESRSHQFPLAVNFVLRNGQGKVDDIDGSRVGAAS